MLRNLAAGLFEHGQIETTLPKAKAVQPFAEKIITIAKRGGLNARRRIEQLINDRKIHSWVADPNVPDSRKHSEYFELPSEDSIEFNRYGDVRKAPRLVQHILSAVAPKFADRDGGYTRIVKIGKHRLGDGTDLVLLQLVGVEEGPQVGGGDSRRRTQKQRRRDFAAKVLVSAPAPEGEEAASESAETPVEEAVQEAIPQETDAEVTAEAAQDAVPAPEETPKAEEASEAPEPDSTDDAEEAPEAPESDSTDDAEEAPDSEAPEVTPQEEEAPEAPEADTQVAGDTVEDTSDDSEQSDD